MGVEVIFVRCKLRDLREAAGYTQLQLAELAGVRKNSIGDYENGIVDMHVSTVIKFCTIFGCTLDDLYTYRTKRK